MREGGRLVHLPASALAVCRETATPTLCLPHEGSSWCDGMARAVISLCQTQQHFLTPAHLNAVPGKKTNLAAYAGNTAHGGKRYVRQISMDHTRFIKS